MKKCLLLVDVQKGFISADTAHVLPKINALLKANLFDYTVATQFINVEDSPFQRFLHWSQLMRAPETDVCKCVAEASELVLQKSTYTAVNDELLAFIKENSIDEVYVAGIDTDCCVLKTAADLFENNIKSCVLEKYSASGGGKKSHDAALLVLSRMIGSDFIIRKELHET
ncbi:MAG: cysteine hydrolase [Bifidobacteriaceae bacterium]|jgi:nicotinamidase-related amidase|nr:cysteine hydrolase [Bifidobacteriaceae bacterium]